jgi:hypothetical protein
MTGTVEITKLMNILGTFGSELAQVDYKQLALEIKDIDDNEKKELLSKAAKMILSGMLVIISA